VAFAAIPVAAGGSESSPLAGWSELALEGRKLLIAKGRSTIARHPSAAGEPRLVVVDSDLQALGVHKEHRAFGLTAPEGRLLAFLEHSPGQKLRTVAVDPSSGDLRVETWRPDESGTLALERAREVELPEPVRRRGVPDPFSLLADLDRLFEGGNVEVLTKDGVTTLAVERGPLRRVTTTLREMDSGERRRVRLDVVELRLSATDDGETLLGMSGPTVLLVERETGALVEISGERDGVPGTVRLSLTGFRAEAGPRPEVPWPAEPPKCVAAWR
jgi:hypothetical protein